MVDTYYEQKKAVFGWKLEDYPCYDTDVPACQECGHPEDERVGPYGPESYCPNCEETE